MNTSENKFYWSIPSFLADKRLLFALVFFSTILIFVDINILTTKLYIAFYCLLAWMATAVFLLFRLVYLSGINQYLFYSIISAIYCFFCWAELTSIILNFDVIQKIISYIIKVLLIAFYIYILRINLKFRLKVERMEPWIRCIYYLSIPYFAISLYNLFIPSNAGKFAELFIITYINLSAFFNALTSSLFEYLRLGKLQDDMEKRNAEILHYAEKAKESTRLKGEFLANMSHELRTPLNGILGSATLLIGTKLNQEQRNYLETLRICGNNLLVIINEILDYSKLEANKLELEHIPFEINTCIENVFELLAPAASAQNTELLYIIDEDVCKIIVSDYTRIQQIITHLVDNAIKFTGNGYAIVKVKSEKKNKNSFVRFEISDTGKGISKKDIGKLFQSFSQLDDSSTRKYGGTGLGLSIARRLTELLGGEIGVKSELGKGSTFSFSVKIDPEECLSNVKEKEAELGQKLIQIQNKIAFVADKSMIQNEMLKDRMEKWGLEVYTATTAQQVLEIPSQVSPSFVLIAIDDIDSAKTRSELISKYMDQQIIFIALLKNSNAYYTEEKVLPSGFAASIAKPIRYSHLLEALFETSSAKRKGNIAGIKSEKSKLADIYPLRILVAEDNVVNQKLITNMLKKFGYLSDIVANGNEVIESLTRNSFDLILMDVQMPELDGIEATKRIIQKYPKSANRPHIIAMTAHARGAEGQVCLDAGMEGYLGKPIDMKELKQVLEFWGSKVNKMRSTS